MMMQTACGKKLALPKILIVASVVVFLSAIALNIPTTRPWHRRRVAETKQPPFHRQQQQQQQRSPFDAKRDFSLRLAKTDSGFSTRGAQQLQNWTDTNNTPPKQKDKNAKPEPPYPTTTSVAPWRSSAILPLWAKDYFRWHQDARHNISSGLNRWQDYRYLVVRCLQHDPKCGGAADRLKPLPLTLVVAHRLRRLLFYAWERPAPLQEFLVPPKDGLDWTWPPHADLANYPFAAKCHLHPPILRTLFGLAEDDAGDTISPAKNPYPDDTLPQIATFRFQTTGHGAQEYNQITRSAKSKRTAAATVVAHADAPEPLYETVFADMWHSMFAPSPPVQERIDDTMRRFDLQTDEYHAIHVRSQYHIQWPLEGLQDLTHNAVNCLYSFLRTKKRPLTPETPIFVSTDDPFATRLTIMYAQSKGLQHVASLLEPNNVTEAQHKREAEEYEKRYALRPTRIEGDRVVRIDKDKQQKSAVEAPSPPGILHLDRGASFLELDTARWTRHACDAYYDTFVDMYLLSKAKCIVFNVGNFGKWANLISSDPSCEYSHMKDKTCSFPANAFRNTR